MEIIATRNASLAADLREALKQHSLKDSPSSKDTPLSEAVAVADADEEADEADDEDMEDETDEEKGVQLSQNIHTIFCTPISKSEDSLRCLQCCTFPRWRNVFLQLKSHRQHTHRRHLWCMRAKAWLC